MTTKTITDQAGDTVRISTGTLTAPTGHVTVKVNEYYLGREYSAAAHADPAALRAALDEVAPLGKYARTAPDPDDMDGGVAAALIEQEAEQHDAADFATAEFARHAESGGVGMRKDAGDPNTWCVAYENPGWRVGIRSDIEMARDGWAPVRECPDPDDHILARDYAAMSDRATAWQKRAEKAEKERDEAIAEASKWREAALRRAQERDEARRERDSWRAQVPLADWEKELVQATAEPRPLTPDAITDEMVERARAEAGAWGHQVSDVGMRHVLTAALTEPPARPEGAEDWEDWLIEAMPHESMPDEDIALLADRIAARLTEEL